MPFKRERLSTFTSTSGDQVVGKGTIWHPQRPRSETTEDYVEVIAECGVCGAADLVYHLAFTHAAFNDTCFVYIVMDW